MHQRQESPSSVNQRGALCGQSQRTVEHCATTLVESEGSSLALGHVLRRQNTPTHIPATVSIRHWSTKSSPHCARDTASDDLLRYQGSATPTNQQTPASDTN
eukprot:362866-Chlamydomonas_euryale.AAC.40